MVELIGSKQATHLPGGDYDFQSMAYDGSSSLMAAFGANTPATIM